MRISREQSPVEIMIGQKQLQNLEHFNYLSNIITNDARYTGEIKSTIAIEKAAFNRKKALFTSKLDLDLRKKLIKCYIWSVAIYYIENWTFREIGQKYLESYKTCC
jgi:putative IMPACT (imprinted ancient) family translation regulator